MISICCVGFASLDVVCYKLNDCVWNVCLISSFLISVCMFIVSKALLISSATVIVRARGAIWLNPFATVLFSVCSAVTVVLCFVPVMHGCVCYYVRKKALFQCLQLPYSLSSFTSKRVWFKCLLRFMIF